MESSKDVQVCIVGAGVCGLTSIKCCLEAGLRVTCFERSPYYGGLWRYRDDKIHPDCEFIPSVMKSTILNTSKELTSFSDYPMPDHLPNFMRHDFYMDYIKSYVENFKLDKYLKLKHEITEIRPEFDDETNSLKWSVDVCDKNLGSSLRKFNCKFDKLILAIGHHNIPFLPQFSDQEKFNGLLVHSAVLKDIFHDERLIDKRVIVVGVGNSALDAANDLSLVAAKCYLSSHRGSWFRSRLTPAGPHDFKERRRLNYYKTKYLNNSLVERQKKKEVEARVNHELLGFTPKHKVTEMAPATNDIFPYRVFTGGVCLKGLLKRFTEEGVVFEGEENHVYECDVVVLATGYTYKVSFLNEVELGIAKKGGQNEHQLYLNVFAPKIILPVEIGSRISQIDAINSLAYVGFAQPAGSVAIVGELQARLAAQVFAGKKSLPSKEEMDDWIDKLEKIRSRSIRSHTRDQVVGSWIGYCDLLAKELGVKPDMSTMFFKDFALWKKLMFGPSVAYQYRLFGPNRWDKARDAIMTVDERVYSGINDGKNHILYKCRRKRLLEEKEVKNSKMTPTD